MGLSHAIAKVAKAAKTRIERLEKTIGRIRLRIFLVVQLTCFFDEGFGRGQAVYIGF